MWELIRYASFRNSSAVSAEGKCTRAPPGADLNATLDGDSAAVGADSVDLGLRDRISRKTGVRSVIFGGSGFRSALRRWPFLLLISPFLQRHCVSALCGVPYCMATVDYLQLYAAAYSEQDKLMQVAITANVDS